MAGWSQRTLASLRGSVGSGDLVEYKGGTSYSVPLTFDRHLTFDRLAGMNLVSVRAVVHVRTAFLLAHERILVVVLYSQLYHQLYYLYLITVLYSYYYCIIPLILTGYGPTITRWVSLESAARDEAKETHQA